MPVDSAPRPRRATGGSTRAPEVRSEEEILAANLKEALKMMRAELDKLKAHRERYERTFEPQEGAQYLRALTRLASVLHRYPDVQIRDLTARVERMERAFWKISRSAAVPGGSRHIRAGGRRGKQRGS